MKRFFKYYYPQIMQCLIIISLFVFIASFMLWSIGEFEKKWLLQTSVISGIVAVMLGTILGKTK